MLEQIVRPFQTPVTIATRRIVAANTQVTVTQAQLRWGDAGAMPSPTEEPVNPDGGISFKLETCDENFNEASRDTDQVNVPNTEDGSQFVTIERIKSISFKKKPQPLVGVIRTVTTTFAADDPFAGTAFGDVPKEEACNSKFNLVNN